jgi:hypothetical protein
MSSPVSTAPARSSIFTLNCRVLFEGADRVFPVEIAGERSVGALKKAIKEEKKPDFDRIPADKLTLWKVSLRIVSKLWLLISFSRFLCPVKVVRKFSKTVKVFNLTTVPRNWTLPIYCWKPFPPCNKTSSCRSRTSQDG